MRRIRVLEMIDRPFLGGGQINLLSLARSLDRTRFEVSVCSRAGGPLVEEVEKSGIRHFPIPFSKKVSRSVIQEIVAIFKSTPVDILHTHGGIAGVFGRWAAHRCGIPVIIHTLHGIHYLHYRNPLLKLSFILLERYFSRFTDAVVLVSDADRKQGERFKLAPENKMHVVENGIDYSAFTPVTSPGDKKRELGIDPSIPVVGSVARLHRQKGIRYLLRAAQKIHHSHPRTKIIILGGGPLEAKLKALNRKWGLEDAVVFLGERKDVLEVLSFFDVFVLPSLWEGLPYAVMEAAALGKPVVASDVDGIRELVKNRKSGLLVPPRDHEELARAVLLLLREREYALELGHQLNREITQEYTLSRMVEKTQELYSRLASEKIRDVLV